VSSFLPAPSIRIRDLTLEWGRRTYVMGVLNVTPDSFSGDGVMDPAAAVARGGELLAAGADIVDVGGESTRPGARPVSPEEELRRVIPVVEALARASGAVVSVDTTKAEVARQALAAGATIVNDVSALRADRAMATVVAADGAPVVLMHGYEGASTWPPRAGAGDIVAEVMAFLRERVEFAVAAGIPRGRILVDPGFGFGKTVAQNLELLRRLGELRALGMPILIGPSRKGTLGRVLGGLPPQERLEGTAAAVTAAILGGADVIRVHDVRAIARVIRMADAIARGVQSDGRDGRP
jgi:dihydropteroate synthase